MTVLHSPLRGQGLGISRDRPTPGRPGLVAIVLAAAFFAAVAPTLTWIEFSGGMENFNLETALEMTRDGHWIVPTLDGQVRTRKPPLATWITALGILSSRNLAWGARWPSLLMASLTLLLVYDLGRVVADERLGLVGACMAGGSLIVLQFARQASYDTQLAFWVMLSNVFIARILLRDQWATGCLGAGAALGMALMTKGPPALLLTVIPPVLLLVIEQVRGPSNADPEKQTFAPATERKWAGRLAWVLAGVLVCLAIALPWTLYVMHRFPGRLSEWYGEVTLAEERRFEKRVGRWLSYVAFGAWVGPWTIWFLGGLFSGSARWWKRQRAAGESRGPVDGVALLLAWVVVPLVGMSFFPERRERYALPIVGPAAVLAGWAMLGYLRDLARPPSDDRPAAPRWPLAAHWAIILCVAVGVPLFGALGVKWMRTVDGGPWFSPATAACGAIASLAIVLATFRWRRPSAGLIAGGGFAMMLAVAFIGASGYAKSPDGRSEALPLVRAVLDRYPDAIVYNAVNRARRRELPLEMTIYFNRVIPRAQNVSGLRPADRPQVILFPDGAEHPPATFTLLARRHIKEEWWNAYVLPVR